MPHLTAIARTRAFAAALLIGGVALFGAAFKSLCATEPVSVGPAVALLTDTAEIAAHQRDVIGTFATGNQPGNRTIAIDVAGHIRFGQLGARAGYNDNSDAFRLARLGKNFCLVTTASGVIEITGLDTLVYERDIYQRR